jgi:uncharacterized tellurite resistance protein B-like protein
MIDAKELKKAIGNAQWELNFATFCEIMDFSDGTYAKEKWQAFQELARCMVAFDTDRLQKLLDYGQKNSGA